MVYKFRPLLSDGQLTKKAEDSLKGGLYFSTPDKFSDPDDGAVEFNSVQSTSEVKSYFEQLCSFGIIPSSLIESGCSISPPQWTAHFNDNLAGKKIEAETYKVFCVCKTWNSEMMWHEYCDGLPGICIGYKTHIFEKTTCLKIKPGQMDIAGNEVNLPFFEVEYSDREKRHVDIFKRGENTDNAIGDVFRLKGLKYSGENELRTMIVRNYSDWSRNLISINDDVITEIVFDDKVPSNIKEECKTILEDNYQRNIAFYDLKHDGKMLYRERISL